MSEIELIDYSNNHLKTENGGFTSRNQESTYMQFVSKLIQVLAEEILGTRTGKYKDTGFNKKIVKIYRALKVMEKQKKTDPKFSEDFKDMALYIFHQNQKEEP